VALGSRIESRSTALPSGSDKRARVRAMFERIAPRYDAMNRLLTGGLDQRWRRAALAAIAVGPGDRVLDLACGTGDLCELARRRGARVVGVDFARGMLSGARRRGVGAALVQGDAAGLPLVEASVDAITCGFAFRNFVALGPVLRECARVLRPAGRLAILEVDRPTGALLRSAHSLYFDRVVPLVGELLSDRAAYRYLPESTAYLPEPAELFGLLAAAGFGALRKRRLALGAAQLVTAERRP
jgi:demethylmenaquinone methyltransferase/2-methoxy-6-polyprenyl-1,4-benzoquinol methylase